MNIKERIKISLDYLTNIRVITLCGLFGALSVTLGYFEIDITEYLSITLAWIPNRVIDCFFGPIVGAVFGGIMNIVKFILRPAGAFNPFFTIVPMVGGFITGIVLFKKKTTLLRVFIAEFLVKLICNIILTTWAHYYFYGAVVSVILPARLIKNITELPVHTIILYMLLKILFERILPTIGEYGAIILSKRDVD